MVLITGGAGASGTLASAELYGTSAPSQSGTLLSPQAQISNLETSVTNLALPKGRTTSLLTKLDRAPAAASAGDVATACASLQDFSNETQAQAGKKIAIADANTLSAAAQRIRAALGC